MAYNRVNWTNSADTPLNAGNLNNMDLGIKKLDDQVSELETKTTMLYSNNLSLHNFTGNTLMLNSKGFETTDNYTVVDNPTEFTTINDWLKLSTASKSGVYGKLSKTIDLWGDGRQLLIKLRVKTSKSGAKIYPVRRLNGNNGTYIDSFCVISSNLTTINTLSHWVLLDTNWHDLWVIIKGNTSDGYELNEIGIFIQSTDNTATTVYVQQFDVFFNNDTAECTGATEEQLKQIQSNTNAIAKLEAETTASIKNINAKLNNIPLKTGYEGKIVSVISDSISTFEGWIPETHRARYPQDDLLTDVNKTWWKMLIDNLGATLGVNDSWAGSRIANYSETNDGDTGPDRCMASMTRIENLATNGTPDVVLLYGGTNDMHYDVTGNKIGAFDPSLRYFIDTTTTVWKDFATAFKDTIMRLQNASDRRQSRAFK
ncbi:MAG: SGNH/GDSL hydrolase family protein [Acutalibacteraceae bacterium]